MRAVEVIIPRIPVIAVEIVAVDIVDKPVPVVINAVARHLALVDPHVGGQVRMVVVNPSVNHRYDNIPRPGSQRPRPDSVNVRPRGAAGLPRVVHAPKLIEHRIVRRRNGVDYIVGLRITNIATLTILAQLLGQRTAVVDLNNLQPRQLDLAQYLHAHLFADRPLRLGIYVILVNNQQTILRVLRNQRLFYRRISCARLRRLNREAVNRADEALDDLAEITVDLIGAAGAGPDTDLVKITREIILGSIDTGAHGDLGTHKIAADRIDAVAGDRTFVLTFVHQLLHRHAVHV